MDTAQWPQEIGLVVKSPMEGMVMMPSAATACSARPQLVERRPRPQKEHALNCPRCQSTNTKFCYYNNYSLSQPRYFCKTCRRYWTEGGSLRNVPVGGGSRKNKRSSGTAMTAAPTTSSSSVTSAKKLPDLAPPLVSSSAQNPKFREGQDLNLAFPQNHLTGEFSEFHNMERAPQSNTSPPNPATCSSAATSGVNALSAMELLRGGISGRGLSPFMPMVMAMPEAGAVYPPGFGLQDFRSNTLSFPVDGIGGGGAYTDVQGVQEGGGRVFFPFEDLRQVSTPDTDIDQARAHGSDPSVFWNGVMGGGGGSW
ncbi:hypothetical protein Taro_004815 [Colocasia esculenta]|uniref:Dof zinc finger protein n=1 Tax=Colocasia esculenta TaxID=4460 RepID=A0A843TJ96_COLES|nr:hypothetical protein [Colocasia esculenta]